MVRSSHRPSAILVVAALAWLLSIASLVGGPSAARAEDSGPGTEPSVVGLVAERCTADTNVWQLSNGQMLAQIFAHPIRFQDAEGNWRAFDTSLIAIGPASYQAVQTPVATRIDESACGWTRTATA